MSVGSEIVCSHKQNDPHKVGCDSKSPVPDRPLPSYLSKERSGIDLWKTG